MARASGAARPPSFTARGARALFLAATVAAGVTVTGCETAPVTGRQQMILMSDSQATEMGLAAYQQILKESKISPDKAMNERVRRVGQRIAAVSGRPDLPWEFNVIQDDTPNAFALPGGKVGVHTGLFKVAQNDDQLATVMAHEVGHAIARHSAERVSQQMALQLGLAGLGMAGSGAQLAQLAGSAATLGVVLPFSRKQEAEADHIGVIMMAKAGYDPRAAVTLWQNFGKLGGDRAPEFLSTHPAPASRIQEIQALMPEAMAVYEKSPKAPR
ncbi:MAG: M48 family metalloprotease [Alphaproteobacteria bacterium]|nr:M48 family metalloprotease [Alphaproteobacteria bacterium]